MEGFALHKKSRPALVLPGSMVNRYKESYLFTMLLERERLTLVAPPRKGNPLWLPCRWLTPTHLLTRAYPKVYN